MSSNPKVPGNLSLRVPLFILILLGLLFPLPLSRNDSDDPSALTSQPAASLSTVQLACAGQEQEEEQIPIIEKDDREPKVEMEEEKKGEGEKEAPKEAQKTPVLVVIDFQNKDSSPDSDWLSSGTGESLISKFRHISALRTPQKNAVDLLLRDQGFSSAKDVPLEAFTGIGKSLGGNYLLFGTYRLAGGSFTLEFNLLKLDTGEEILKETLSDRQDELFTAYLRIVELVVEEIGVQISEAEYKRLSLEQTKVTTAYRDYVKARAALANTDPKTARLEPVNRKRLPEAAALLQSSLKADPGFAPAHNAMGLVYLMNQDAVGAEKEFRKAIQLDDGYLPAYLNLGNLLVATARGSDGEKLIRKGIDLNPNLIDGYLLLGIVLERQKNYVGAEKVYKEAVTRFPDSSNLLFNYGNVERLLQKYEEAASAYQEALKINTTYANAHYNLALCYEKLGKTELAVQHFQEYLRLEPKAGDKDKVLERIKALKERSAGKEVEEPADKEEEKEPKG